MITIKSNIKEFLKAYRERVDKVKNVLNTFAEKLAERMREDMNQAIISSKAIWAPVVESDNPKEKQDERGKMGTYSSIPISISSIGENAVRVSIGDTLRPHTMKDGKVVNPAFFIEFGFGIIGQNNPMQNANEFGWIYNKSGHQEAWWYVGFDGGFRLSAGAKGINFMYNTIQRYKEGWKKFLQELMESANV